VTPSQRFLELAAKLGGISRRALDNFFYVQNPFGLQNWTMNVVELLMIAAAALALAHAITVRRRIGDSSYVGVWVAAALYCIAIEVPIYFFPSMLGLDDGSVIFIHNEFTAGAFFGRMPLYILALYPALLYPAYVLVRQRGLFDQRWGLIRGAICVGVVHHCFYEIFDQLGPQLKWWLWDYELPKIGDVTFASVPLFSQVNFSLVNPIAFALLAHALLGHRFERVRDHRSRNTLVVIGMTVLVGVLTPAFGGLLSVNQIYAQLAEHPNRIVIAGLGYAIIAVTVLIAFSLFWRTRSRPLHVDAGAGFPATYVPIFAVTYLVAFILLWGASLNDYVHATGGLTAMGTPIGSLPYATACAVACVWFITPYLSALRRAGNQTRSAATQQSDTPVQSV
jgi:hypothetical protein